MIFNDKITEATGKECIKLLNSVIDKGISNMNYKREKDHRLSPVNDGPFDFNIVLNNIIGGDLDTTFAIYDYLQLVKQYDVRITTTALNRCMSSASIIFMAGDIRRAGNHTNFLIHNSSISLDSIKADKLSGQVQRLQRYDRSMAELYSSVGKKKSVQDFVDLMKLDDMTSSKQCLEYGIVTELF